MQPAENSPGRPETALRQVEDPDMPRLSSSFTRWHGRWIIGAVIGWNVTASSDEADEVSLTADIHDGARAPGA
ncbi:hypothetical protein GCM10027456_81940 [Kineosporia babensis]